MRVHLHEKDLKCTSMTISTSGGGLIMDLISMTSPELQITHQ